MELRAFTSNSSMKMFAMRGLMGDPIATPWTCSQYLPWKRKDVFVRQNSSREVICGIDMLVLCGRVLSSCNLSLTICMVGWTETEVNKAFTSKEVMTSPGSNFFTMELLNKVSCVFEMVWGLAYKGS